MKKRIQTLFATSVVVFIVIIGWIYFPLYYKGSKPYEAFSALCSALAFAGVIVTLFFQLKELELQRTELTNSVKAQSDSARALEDQSKKTLLVIQADAYFKVIETLQSDKVIEARKMVFKLEQNGVVKDYGGWTEKEKKNAEELIRRYDSIGLMAFNGLLPHQLIVDGWGSSLKKSWIIVKGFLENLRIERNAPELWNDYEWLVKMAFEYEIEYLNKDLTYQSGNKVSAEIMRMKNGSNDRKK